MSTSPVNPYQPPVPGPSVASGLDGERQFALPATTVDAGRGASWISEGWALFTAAPWLWIVALLIFWGVQVVLGVIPVLGGIASMLLGPLFAVGILAFADGIAQGEPADLGKLFVGLKHKLAPLLALALLNGVLMLVVLALGLIVVIASLGSSGVLSSLLGASDPEQAVHILTELAMVASGLLAILVGALVVVALMTLLAAAFWFAPGLIFFANLGVVEAMQQSFVACVRNWLPFLVYSILGLGVLLMGTMTLLVGLLVALPVLMASYYISFRDIFGRQVVR